ncbi:MAG: hypothetical protein R3236_08625, partial [Phycisphaeraceae bacterium]|nr:hypothetical protein [Phycisphaeraceae bacterium]
AHQHGAVKEGALSVKVDGAKAADLIVRVWLGSEDRTGSVVAKAEYKADHQDFDAHVELPDPMPEGAQWWVEVQKGEEKFLLSFDVKQ